MRKMLTSAKEEKPLNRRIISPARLISSYMSRFMSFTPPKYLFEGDSLSQIAAHYLSSAQRTGNISKTTEGVVKIAHKPNY
jgi:hypothetical protein